MSSNFLDVSGLMAGTDIHIYYTVVPPAPAPVPVPDVYAVFSVHLSFSRWWRIVPSVTTGHCPVLQSSWAMQFCIPHIPVPIGPPHPAAEPAELAVLWGTASSAPQLSAHSVTGKGTALLTAIVGPVGMNSNCGMQGMAPLNVDLNFNSVKTTPSLGDYAAAVVGAYLNGIYNAAAAFIPVPIPSIILAADQVIADIASRLDIPIVPWIFDPYTQVINKITSWVQSAVDG